MATFFGGFGSTPTQHGMNADQSIELALANAKEAAYNLQSRHFAMAFNRLMAASFQYGMYMADVSAAGGPTDYQQKLAKQYGEVRQTVFDALQKVLRK